MKAITLKLCQGCGLIFVKFHGHKRMLGLFAVKHQRTICYGLVVFREAFAMAEVFHGGENGAHFGE